jgi:hypothetical protein
MERKFLAKLEASMGGESGKKRQQKETFYKQVLHRHKEAMGRVIADLHRCEECSRRPHGTGRR